MTVLLAEVELAASSADDFESDPPGGNSVHGARSGPMEVL